MFSTFGSIDNPFTTLGGPAGLTGSTNGTGLIVLLGTFVKFAMVLAGVYTFWNLISAGFMFISAGGEPKNISKAWAKIWQSVVGLLVVAASFLLAVIIGFLIYGPDNAFILIRPRIFQP